MGQPQRENLPEKLTPFWGDVCSYGKGHPSLHKAFSVPLAQLAGSFLHLFSGGLFYCRPCGHLPCPAAHKELGEKQENEAGGARVPSG